MNDFQVNNIWAKAFISCSLRNEDKPFIEMVEKILRIHGIEPFGTIGRYSVAPENTAESMKRNIPLADLVVIIATPRYQQTDLKTGFTTLGLSESVHVETGIAYAENKPVVVFVKEGTNIGTFLPNITQYITLNGYQKNYQDNYPKIFSLLNNANLLINNIRDEQSSSELIKLGIGFFAVVGAYNFGKDIFSTPKRRDTNKRNVLQRKKKLELKSNKN